jgi:YVTN family beta-propeller protein
LVEHYNATSNKVYCANTDNNSIVVIDASADTVVATVQTGLSPFALLWDSLNNTVYCANTGSHDVTIVDGVTNQVIATIPVGKQPVGLGWNPVQNRVYVADWWSSCVSVIRDSVSGVAEAPGAEVHAQKRPPTIIRDVLLLPQASSLKPQAASLLDAAGRKVADLRPGANDVSRLSPGVYFVRDLSAVSRGPSAVSVRKVVIQK